MKIGIFGGSFDPVHSEHIKLAENIINEFSIDKLIICPAFIPPHKIGQTLSDFDDRYNMLKLAFKDCDKVEISDFEKVSKGTSYTYLTIEHFKNVYKDSEFYFLVGTDMLLDFPTWKNPDKILHSASLIVTSRAGEDQKKAIENYYDHFSKKILFSSYNGTNLSSTKIKTYIKLSIDTTEFLPSQILEYIEKKALYKSNNYYIHVKNELPQKRLRHTANVIILAIKLAKMIGVDAKKAELASLLHDVSKYKSTKDFPNFKIPSFIPKEIPDKVMHQFLGAYVAEEILNIKDEDILNAIRFHTTGRAHMSDLEKVVFIADLIEEDRNYPHVDEIRQNVFKNFHEGFSFAVTKLVEFLGNTSEEIYPLTIECQKYYN